MSRCGGLTECPLMLDDLIIDLRYAARTLLRSPAFSLAAVVTIALGVGVNTGLFTVVNGLLFRDIPVPDGHEVVSIGQTVEGATGRAPSGIGLATFREYEAYRDRTRTLEGLVGHSDPTRTTIGGDEPRQVVGLLVTCNWFDVLREAPELGRGLTERDCEPGADPVAVLGHEFWAEQFASDPGVIGSTIELNRQLVTVVGIAPAGGYDGILYRSAYLAPISAQPLLLPNEPRYDDDNASFLFLLGRRAAGTSLAQVRAELDVIAAQIDADDPGRSTTLTVERATPLPIPQFRRVALAIGAVVMSAFGLVLLIACANVANLMLGRSAARSRELALRTSLGASRGRVVRQLLAESLLLALVGGAVGSILSLWSFQLLIARVLPSFSPAGLPKIMLDATPDVHVLAFTLALTAGSGILFGLVPALRASKIDLSSVIKDDSAGAVGGRAGGRLNGALVGVQVAMCMTLMISAGLLLRGLYATQIVEPGFDFSNVTVASYRLAEDGYSVEQAAVFQTSLRESVATLPGVESVSFVSEAPLTPGTANILLSPPSRDGVKPLLAGASWVSAEYFDLLRLPIVAGRTFTSGEIAAETDAAVVTESTAAHLWPGQDPIGRTITWRFSPTAEDEMTLRVVGVARDAQISQIGEIDPYFIYLPATPRSLPFLQLLVRSRTGFDTTAPAVRDAIAALDPRIVATIVPLESNVDYMRTLSRAVSSVAGSLGLLALVLASVGIYGVVAYFIARRLREIGIRLALGASARDVLGLVLMRTLRPVVIGAAIGLAISLVTSRVLASMLFGVSPADPVGLGAAMVLVLAIALGVALAASRRAIRTDPVVTLRHD